MQLIRRSTQIIAVAILGVSYGAHADSWNCSHDDLVREVQIEYPEGGSVPCNVIYKKQTEGFEDQVLWSAESQEGYCEEKAREFVGKLESWGWVCLETVSAAADTEQAEEAMEETEQAVEEAVEETEQAVEETEEAMEEAVESEKAPDTQ
jgi:hypothetical protein